MAYEGNCNSCIAHESHRFIKEVLNEEGYWCVHWVSEGTAAGYIDSFGCFFGSIRLIHGHELVDTVLLRDRIQPSLKKPNSTSYSA